MLGGAALLADGILTPAVTVTTAIEGLRTIPAVHHIMGDNQMNVVIITLIIVCLLFAVQRAGTSKIGRAFGPVMTFWFLFLGGAGLVYVLGNPVVLLAFNPIRGISFLLSPHNHAGIMILGSCFLATTGAEALYSDMGHVGRGNIYATWPVRQDLPHPLLPRSGEPGCSPTPATPTSPPSPTSTRSSRCCQRACARSASSCPPAPPSSPAKRS